MEGEGEMDVLLAQKAACQMRKQKERDLSLCFSLPFLFHLSNHIFSFLTCPLPAPISFSLFFYFLLFYNNLIVFFLNLHHTYLVLHFLFLNSPLKILLQNTSNYTKNLQRYRSNRLTRSIF